MDLRSQNFQNQQIIDQIYEKKQKEQEEIKKLKMLAKFQNKIYFENDFTKQDRQYNPDQYIVERNIYTSQQNKQMSTNHQSRKHSANVQRNNEKQVALVKEQIPDYQKEENKKLNNYFRSRYISFISSLKENQKLKKYQDEMEKQKEQKKKDRLRDEIGIKNINSKLLEPTQAALLKQKERNASGGIQLKRRSSSQDLEEISEEEKKRRQKMLLEKQKELLKRMQIQKQEELQQKESVKQKEEQVKDNLRQFILGQLKNHAFREDETSPNRIKQIEKDQLARQSSPQIFTKSQQTFNLNSNKIDDYQFQSNQLTKQESRHQFHSNLKYESNQNLQIENITSNHKNNNSTKNVNVNKQIQSSNSKSINNEQKNSSVKTSLKNLSIKNKEKEQETDNKPSNYQTLDRDKRDYSFKEIKITDSQSKYQSKALSLISDLKMWKRKQRIDEFTKVFIVSPSLNEIKNALINRGWVENQDLKSFCFDYKCTLTSKEIDFDALQEFQIVNHIQKSSQITSKIGLAKNLRNLIWFNNVDIDSFYPRCFDLSDQNELEDFYEEFKTSKAESILKLYMHYFKKRDFVKIDNIKSRTELALQVCQRKTRDLDQIIDDFNHLNLIPVTKQEWQILSSDELSQETLAKKKHDEWMSNIGKSREKIPRPNKKKQNKQEELIQSFKPTQQTEESEQNDPPQMDEFTLQVKNMLAELKGRYPQYKLNSLYNIWILKPAGMSKGRGIVCYRNLVEIMDHVRSKESQWIAQKYIEKPMLILKRKFDIRQWVLVTSMNPLTIWFYNECYICFSAEKYDINKLENKQQQLKNQGQKNQIILENDDIPGNTWVQYQLQDYLKQSHHGNDYFLTTIQPKMKQIVIWSLQSVQEAIETKKNTHQLFRFDFMLDKRFDVWLIEVNCSGLDDISLNSRLVKEVSEELVKVVLEGKGNKMECIFKGNSVVEKMCNVGINLYLEGKQIKRS